MRRTTTTWGDPRDDAALTERWARAAAAHPSPFTGPDVVEAWRRAFAPDADVQACVVTDADEVVGAWAFRCDGGRLSAAANVHVPMVVPYARDARALAALTDAVVARGAELDVPDLELGPDLDAAIAGACRRHGARRVFSAAAPSPYVDTSGGSFAAWRAATHPTWLSRLARYRRQMDRRHELRIAVGDDDDPLALYRDGLVVEASGWKGEQGTAIAQNAATRGYYATLVERWHATGELRLSGLWLDGELAAFDLGVARAGRWYSLKTGYAEHRRTLSPGLVLRLAIVERCFDTGVLAHDLLGEHADWKDRLASGDRVLRRLRLYPRRPAPIARYLWKTRVRRPLAALAHRG